MDALPETLQPPTIHATALVIGRRGILISGPSGAGKSALAFHLVVQARRDGRFSAFIADDRVVVARRGGRLVASAPPVIAGRAEMAGLGILDVPAVPGAVLDLAVMLVPQAALERLPEPATTWIDGVGLPQLAAPMRDAEAAAWLILRHGALAGDAILAADRTEG